MPPPAGDREFALIEWIRDHVDDHPLLQVGIGDDAAVIDLEAPSGTLIATDMLVEGVHFSFDAATPEQVGRKALAVNLSDIAAMAGTAVAAVTAVALPRGFGGETGRRLHAGLAALAAETGVAVAGGDTTSTEGPLVITVTVLGVAASRGPVLRSTARPGDVLLVTGALGGSGAGHHLDFVPRLTEARALEATGGLQAMIDISDGLAADLHHLLAESRCGARVRSAEIPIAAAAREAADGRTPLAHALGDGEDFELLLAFEKELVPPLLDDPPFDTPLTVIGEITETTDAVLEMPDGRLVPLAALGYEHRL